MNKTHDVQNILTYTRHYIRRICLRWHNTSIMDHRRVHYKKLPSVEAWLRYKLCFVNSSHATRRTLVLQARVNANERLQLRNMLLTSAPS